MKLTEIPKACDACNKAYSNLTPERKLQRKAIYLIGLGCTVTIVWVAALAAVCWLFVPPAVLDYIEHISIILVCAVIILIVSAPGAAIIGKALLLPKVVRRKCLYCHEVREFVIDTRGYSPSTKAIGSA